LGLVDEGSNLFNIYKSQYSIVLRTLLKLGMIYKKEGFYYTSPHFGNILESIGRLWKDWLSLTHSRYHFCFLLRAIVTQNSGSVSLPRYSCPASLSLGFTSFTVFIFPVHPDVFIIHLAPQSWHITS